MSRNKLLPISDDERLLLLDLLAQRIVLCETLRDYSDAKRFADDKAMHQRRLSEAVELRDKLLE